MLFTDSYPNPYFSFHVVWGLSKLNTSSTCVWFDTTSCSHSDLHAVTQSVIS